MGQSEGSEVYIHVHKKSDKCLEGVNEILIQFAVLIRTINILTIFF